MGQVNTLICSKCSNVGLPGDMFCRNCGNPLISENQCKNCGNFVQPQDLYCTKCGSPLGSKKIGLEHTEAVMPIEKRGYQEPGYQELQKASSDQQLTHRSAVTCPACGMQVVPEADGTCPNCQAVIQQQEKDQTSRIQEFIRIAEDGAVLRSSAPINRFGGDQELQDYVLKKAGLNRWNLNLMCFIGFFIFGWLLAIAFDMLGKKKPGLFYVITLIICLAISRFIEPQIGYIGLFVYIIGVAHANYVLSGYKSSAWRRIGQIEELSGDQLTTDIILEKGILQQKVLADREAAISTLGKALQMSGGDGQLLTLAGVVMYNIKRYPEAMRFFSRALQTVKDDALIKQIKINMTNVNKKLNKS